VVSATGAELTSNYVLRYRDTLRRRGEWTLVDSVAAAPAAGVIVRPHAGWPAANDRVPGPRIFDSPRFTAWLRPTH